MAIKKKYSYNQFVVNDYLNSFNKHRRLVIFSNTLEELAGETHCKVILNHCLNEFLNLKDICE